MLLGFSSDHSVESISKYKLLVQEVHIYEGVKIEILDVNNKFFALSIFPI